MQTSLLFSDSIRENIAYGRPDASGDEVIAAAKAAHAHEFITEMPEGYETVVGERGMTLSGGQRQRVAIARALLMNPRILILDDLLSSVDTQTEKLIQEALDKLMEGRTTFCDRAPPEHCPACGCDIGDGQGPHRPTGQAC